MWAVQQVGEEAWVPESTAPTGGRKGAHPPRMLRLLLRSTPRLRSHPLKPILGEPQHLRATPSGVPIRSRPLPSARHPAPASASAIWVSALPTCHTGDTSAVPPAGRAGAGGRAPEVELRRSARNKPFRLCRLRPPALELGGDLTLEEAGALPSPAEGAILGHPSRPCWSLQEAGRSRKVPEGVNPEEPLTPSVLEEGAWRGRGHRGRWLRLPRPAGARSCPRRPHGAPLSSPLPGRRTWAGRCRNISRCSWKPPHLAPGAP